MKPLFDGLSLVARRRLPVVYQSEGAECGLACLAMIARFHAIPVDMAALRERFSISMRGATLGQLLRIATRLNLSARPLRADLDHLPQLALPCLLHWGFSHFVVLESFTKQGAVLHDPASGRREATRRELSEMFTGVAVEFSPLPVQEALALQRPFRWRELIGPVTGLKRSVAQILVLASMLELVAIAGPLFFQLVVDRVGATGDRRFLAALGATFIALMLFQQLIGALRSWAVAYLSTDLNLQWLNTTFVHLLRLPVSFFEKRHLGDIVSRFEAVNAIQAKLSTSLIEAVIDGVMAVVTLAVMAHYAVGLTLVNLAAVLAYLLVRVALMASMRQANEEAVSHAATQHSLFLETMRGIKSIKLFNRMHERRTRWLNVYVDQVNAEVRSRNLAIVYRACSGTLFGLEKIVIVWLGALAMLDGDLTLGMLVAFVAFKDQFTARVVALIDKAMDIRMLDVQGARLAEITHAAPERGAGSAASMSADEPVTLEIRQLRFRYADEEPWILRQCSAVFAPGDYVAIIAPSGTGKSTFLKVLLGLLPPDGGEILVDGRSVDSIGLDAYRELFGVVLQDDDLFAGSIAANIAFFDLQADLARIEECARLACIHEDVMRMPMQYYTLVGDMGSVLSGGQKQRVLLARALYRRPRILVLDEATSHLDHECELAVTRAIDTLSLVRIVIAHRHETIARASRVLELVDGRLVEQLPARPVEILSAA